jgi:methylated-DNA-[protein]-cysteine S-methyltransferase
MIAYYAFFESPIQPLLLVSDGESLTGLYMSNAKSGAEVGEEWIRREDLPVFLEAKRQLTDYFEGRLKAFSLPLAFQGTEFQKRVWKELLRIPFGETISYGELARRVGDANASRAVGGANGKNPISIIAPCHRVIGSNGKLTGYGGGLERKEALLAFEGEVKGRGEEGERNAFDWDRFA